MNPFLGRNFEAMDPLEWLARLGDHIPDTGKHGTHFLRLLRQSSPGLVKREGGLGIPGAAPTREVVRVLVGDEGWAIQAG